jgi:(4S)-4-hydroxy-5-phosphonooxypentane-2,3-dione isomerase
MGGMSSPSRSQGRTRRGMEEGTVLALIARYRTQPGQGDTVEALLREMTAAVGRDEPDCLLFRVTRSPRDGERFLLYEEYVDEGALEAHRRTPHFRDLIEGKVIPLLLEREREVMVPIT